MPNEVSGLSQVITREPESNNRNSGFSLVTRRVDVSKLPTRASSQDGTTSTAIASATASATESETSPGGKFTWTVLWDIENVPIPIEHNGAQIVHAMGKSLSKLRHGMVRRIVTFVDINKLRHVHRNELQSHGVLLNHVETAGRKDAADKALIVELMLTALDVPPPAGIALISGDQDYAYPIAILRQRGYTTTVIAPDRIATSPLLASVPEFVLSFKGDMLRGVPALKRPKAQRKRKIKFAGGGGGNATGAACGDGGTGGTGGTVTGAGGSGAASVTSATIASGAAGAAGSGGSGGSVPRITNSKSKTNSAANRCKFNKWSFFRNHRVQMLLMILAAFSIVHLIRALAIGVFDIMCSATLHMVIVECIHAISLRQIFTHVVMGLILFGTLKILRSTGAGFKGMVLLRTPRHYYKKTRRKRPTTLINPPNL